MDVATISQLIGSLGFPIVACLYMAWNGQQQQKTITDLTATLSELKQLIEDKLKGD